MTANQRQSHFKIMMRHFNAKVGKNDTNKTPNRGKYGLRNTTERGETKLFSENKQTNRFSLGSDHKLSK